MPLTTRRLYDRDGREHEVKELWLVDDEGPRRVWRVYDRTAGRFAAVSVDFASRVEATEWMRGLA